MLGNNVARSSLLTAGRRRGWIRPGPGGRARGVIIGRMAISLANRSGKKLRHPRPIYQDTVRVSMETKHRFGHCFLL